MTRPSLRFDASKDIFVCMQFNYIVGHNQAIGHINLLSAMVSYSRQKKNSYCWQANVFKYKINIPYQVSCDYVTINISFKYWTKNND